MAAYEVWQEANSTDSGGSTGPVYREEFEALKKKLG